ncbi:hypothetical protein AgCh_039211 [Apium graveolens]
MIIHEEVSFNKPAELEVGVNSVDDDITYAAETEDREDTDLSFLKISLKLATGLKHVNEYNKASQGDQEAIDAGTECSENLELCSISVILANNPVDVTVAVESDDNNNIPLREPGVFEPTVMKIHAKAALVETPEHWRSETYMFHFPVGECNTIVQDVNVLLGLRIDGDVVSGIQKLMMGGTR